MLMLSHILLAQQISANHTGAILRVHLDQPVARVSPILYGLMTEEINHSYDGGIYAELVRNRAFQDRRSSPEYWQIQRDGDANASMEIDRSTGPARPYPAV